jgi:hypothetical protein
VVNNGQGAAGDGIMVMAFDRRRLPERSERPHLGGGARIVACERGNGF